MSDWDKITTSTPVNQQAAKQMGGGVSFSPSGTLTDYWEEMPPIKSRVYDGTYKSRDYTGMKFGRLSVLGRSTNEKANSWICRCQCGGYCSRKTKSLKSALNGDKSFLGMCGQCYYTVKLRAGWSPKAKEVDYDKIDREIGRK